MNPSKAIPAQGRTTALHDEDALVKAPGSSAIDDLRFENIAISVSDLDRVATWYQQVLGFNEVRRGEFPTAAARFIFLEGKGMRIELISTGKAVPTPLPQPPTHLETTGFKAIVLHTDDLALTTRELESKGVTIVWRELSLTEDIAATLIRDPEGNFINVFGPLTS